MKKLLIISVIALVALLSVKQQFVLAEEVTDSMSGGFYTRIYERIESESHEKALEAVTKRMGISAEDIITIAQGGNIESLRDMEGIARIELVKELGPDERKEYLKLLADFIEAIPELQAQLLSGSPLEIEAIDSKFASLEPRVPDRTHELIANREELAAEFAFEQSLMELEIELEEEVKAIEVFADGVLDDMSGDADYSYSTAKEKILLSVQGVKVIGDLFGGSDITFEDVEELPRFDLIHDLEVIDYLIFGTGEIMKLSSAGEGGFGLSSDEGGAGGGGAGGDGDDDDDGSPGSPPTGGDGTGGSDTIPPGSLNQPLDPDDMYDPEGRDGGDDGYKSLQCKVGVGVDLDYGPRDQLENLEESLIASNLARLFPAIEPTEGEEGVAGIVKGLSELASLKDIGITSEGLQEAMPESEFAEGECFTAEFDIIFCYKFEAGTYAKPKVFKNDNCIACHVNKINEIFGTKLLPYSLKARKNEGLTGGGSYCSDVNEAEMGMQIMAIAKPLNFYKDVCYPDPDEGTEPPLNDPAKKIKEVQENYLKAVLTLQEQVDVLYRDRADKVKQKRDVSGSEVSDLNAEILNIELQIIRLEDQILTLRETNTLILHQWRTLKEDYEESTGCKYNIGASAVDGFDDVLEKYNKELKGTVPSAHVSETVESMMTTRLLSLEPENIANVFDAVERATFYKEERYREGQEIDRNAQKLADAVEKVRMLGKEVQEMTTHFGAFKSAMESLRKPRDRSVLKKLSKKETP